MTKPTADPVPAKEFARNFGHYQDEATLRRFIRISSNGRPKGAYLCEAEFARYLALRQRETKVVRIDDLPDDLAADLERTVYGEISR